MARKTDPFKHHSTMTAKAALVVSKAGRIDAIADELIRYETNPVTEKRLIDIKVRAQQIVDLVEND